MSDLQQRLAKLSPAQRALLEQRLGKQSAPSTDAASDAPHAEPLAIVGMACRLPGGATLDEYWETIRTGRSVATQTPADRWDVERLAEITDHICRFGCYLDGLDQFDPQFFSITPREAARMDPQQRLLLEVAWEALENGGLPASQLAGSNTGVFVGIGGSDYSKVPIHQSGDYFGTIDGYMGTGNALSIAANRLSYVFDLKGPSLAVDTACSSSSVAITLAAQALRRGECAAAIAAGVNAILTPETTLAFSSARMLSPTGECRPFDAAANGYVRGEGCGVVVLKRLSDAQAAGDNVMAVLRAAAINQDGRTSGISAPNGESQKLCIRAALKQAGLTTDDVSYIEAHGTGTPLGDPIELRALGDLFPEAANKRGPLHVASVKANIGHTETVSGIAGLIKIALMMRHGRIPPHAGFQSLNPHIELAGTRLQIPTDECPWEGPLRAGISSFGFGGTNSHLIVEAAAQPTSAASPSDEQAKWDSPSLIKLSAKTPEALRASAAQLAAWADTYSASPLPIAAAANAGRSDFAERAVVTAADTLSMREQLLALAEDEPTPVTQRGTAPAGKRPKVAMLFSGQGSQHPGMGRDLYDALPVFQREIDRVDNLLADVLETPLREVLFGEGDAVHQTVYTQPALFAVEWALATVWRELGVEPDFVAGHSIGEYVAAAVAGVMTVEDAARLVAERARLMQQAPSGGRMAAAFTDEATAALALRGLEDRVAIAAVNTPETTVLSGEADAVAEATQRLEGEGVTVRELTVSHAFHSPQMDDVLDDFEAFAATITFAKPDRPMASNLTGKLHTEAPTARYWRDHLRHAVRFADNLHALDESGATRWIEAGPGASLLGMAKRTLDSSEAVTFPSLRQGRPDGETLSAAVAGHYAAGGRIDWRRWTKLTDPSSTARQPLLLPTYPFERSRFWLEDAGEVALDPGRLAAPRATMLLGSRIDKPGSDAAFAATWSPREPGYLLDHKVGGSAVAPASALVELALQAAHEALGEGRHAVEGVAIGQALFFQEDAATKVHTRVEAESAGRAPLEVFSQPAGSDAPWQQHATAVALHERVAGEPPTPPADTLRSLREGNSLAGDDFYRQISGFGFDYGPTFQVISTVAKAGGAAYAEFQSTPATRSTGDSVLHPVLGDGCMQTFAAAVQSSFGEAGAARAYMPVAIGKVHVLGPVAGDTKLSCLAAVDEFDGDSEPDELTGDAWLMADDGAVVAAFTQIRVRAISASGSAEADTPAWRHEIQWSPAPLPSTPEERASASGLWVVLADRSGVADRLVEQLEARGGRCVLVHAADEFTLDVDGDSDRTQVTIDQHADDHYQRLLDAVLASPGAELAGVVFCWAMDTPPVDIAKPGPWPEAASGSLQSARRLVQSLAERRLRPRAGLSVVTRGAQPIGHSHSATISQAPLLGFARVARSEHPDLRPRLIDLDDGSFNQLADEVLATATGQDEVAYRGGERRAPRLRPIVATPEVETTLPVPRGPYQLRLGRAGSIDGLRHTPFEPVRPGPGQVTVDVHSAGLNFSDVLKALGLYPGLEGKEPPLGIEMSGVVTAVGEGVDRFAVGDEVFGVAPSSFASHATTGEFALVRKPATISHEGAATLPITFLTAHHALVRLAGLSRGERVLIHAGAGGVGLAAIQIAQTVGAEVFATAGSEAKRDYLRSLGVRHVMNSRTLDFTEEVFQATNREGVDVVLNSLPGEAIPASLGLLRAYGRFLEIGKTDIYQDRRLGLAPFRDNLSYFAIDLDRVLRQRPEYIRGLFAEVLTQVERGAYRPLERTSFAPGDTPAAFRYMQQRKNIGKVVVSKKVTPRAPAEQHATVRSDGAYLVTGGLGAIGLRLASRLVAEGAGAVVLLSRSEPKGEAAEAIDRLRATGANIVHARADVADEAALRGALSALPAKTPPLRGVLHAAGVLDDGLIGAMTAEQLDRVLSPKARGGWNLHRATIEAPLDFFVLFSSVASVLGSPGQANYAAGNAALDALAHARRAAGMPAVSVNWGPWAEGGMADDPDVRASIEAKGMRLLEPEAALDQLFDLLRDPPPQACLIDPDWPAMARVMGDSGPALLAEVLPQDGDAGRARSAADAALVASLLAAGDGERLAMLVDLVRNALARVMSTNPNDLDTTLPLAEFGIDSLMSLELKNGLERRLGVTVPMAKLLEGPSIDSLAEELAKLLTDGDGPAKQDEWAPITPLRRGEAPPLVLLPTLGGDALCYRTLAERIESPAAVTALRPRGLGDGLATHQDMSRLAADYAVAIGTLQPEGGLRLAGWSTAGVLAVAVAEQLERGGREVELVAMFDSPTPDAYRSVELDDEASLLHETMQFASQFSGLEINLGLSELRAIPADARFSAAADAARSAGLFQGAAAEEAIRQVVEVGVGLIRACAGYTPTGLKCPLRLFEAESADRLPRIASGDSGAVAGWADLPGFETIIEPIEGDHFTMMTGPGAKQLARRLDDLL
ncbi:MAG: SDR family NAD(P)-dependent oxidoreductase [Planctomycetota bacterium]